MVGASWIPRAAQRGPIGCAEGAESSHSGRPGRRLGGSQCVSGGASGSPTLRGCLGRCPASSPASSGKMFYHVSQAGDGGKGRVAGRSEAGRREKAPAASRPVTLPCLAWSPSTFPADLPGARDPAAPALLWPQPAQHGEAEALHRGGGDLHRQVSAAW